MLKQNSKIKKSGNKTELVYNFGIPAFKSIDGLLTCPNATNCVTGCYAKQGTYNFNNVKNAYESRLSLTFKDSFSEDMNSHIKSLKRQGKRLNIRIHDSGDFYSAEYLNKWLDVIKSNPDVRFYAYTKMISMFKEIVLPENFTVIYSFGGREDHLINVLTDKHAMVFQTLDQLNEYGYHNCSDNDLEIFNSNKVGLVYHGNKSYSKTFWYKVLVYINNKRKVA